MAAAPPLPPPTADPRDLTTVGLDEVSSLCTTQQTPNVMNGLWLRLLQEHFSSPRNLVHGGRTEDADQLQGVVWKADPRETKILIEPLWRYKVQDIQRRPAVIVKRNKWQTQRLGINDGMTVSTGRDAAGRVRQIRGALHSRLVMGSHTLFCVGETGAAAELLGTEVWDLCMSFAPVIRQDFKLHRAEVQDLEAPVIVDEETEHWGVPVVVAYAFIRSWRLDVEAPWLKSFAVGWSGRQGRELN